MVEKLGSKGPGCRKLFALVTNLPPDAALWRAQQPEGQSGYEGSTNGSSGGTRRVRAGDPDAHEAVAEFFRTHVDGDG